MARTLRLVATVAVVAAAFVAATFAVGMPLAHLSDLLGARP